jgi:geranylgeranyl diphosphate synthase type I
VSQAYIHSLLQQHVPTPELRTILDEILQQPGRVFSASPKWVSLVRDTAHALGGDHPAVPMAAAAVEFTVAATDVVDDLADAEWPSAAITPARALNATLLLSHLSHQVVTDLGEQIGAARAWQISRAITTGMATACAGEDADLRFETLPTVDLEAAHTMTMQKSGALMGMVCQVGALVAIATPQISALVGSLGRHIGVIAQLLNDIAGINPDATRLGSDLTRRKKTLPIAAALLTAQQTNHAAILEWAHSDAPLDDAAARHLAAQMRDLGALQYAWVVALAHRHEARLVLAELEPLIGPQAVQALAALIPTLDREAEGGEEDRATRS